MIRVREIKVPLNDDYVKKYVALKLKINKGEINNLKINKKSIDARKKEKIHYVYEVDIELRNEKNIKFSNNILKTPKEEYKFNDFGNQKMDNRPVIVGAGPAGLFCAYILAENGYKPIVIERGEQVEKRVEIVSKFWETGKLDKNTNVQFGEGGAGTFSDGKLNTLVKDKKFRMLKVFDTFIEMGAPIEIKYLNKPHIGTDLLRNVIINMRNKIIQMGGEFKYNTLMTDIIIDDNNIQKIVLNDEKIINTDVLVLATGHSSRDTIEMLYKKEIKMIPKSFAMGFRVQHSQKMINKNQYGDVDLPPASYKLTHQVNGRGVYSFCMCPGGYVVNSSSEENRMVVNGMSNHLRDSGVANSAIVVTISPNDFGSHPLDGVKFQRKVEEKAYEIGKCNIPVQLYKDFKNNKVSESLDNCVYAFKGKFSLSNLVNIYPSYVNEAFVDAMEHFDKKIKGFAADNVIIAAPESRTSSPVRIERDENLESSIKGIYPCGEGAGYAGGITTSAMDGIKVAEAIMSKYKK